MLVNVGLYKFDLSTNSALALNLNNLIIGAASVAIVSVLETMISAKYAAHRTETRFSQRYETFALSLANIVSGALGGIPCTGVLVRTALNIDNGATHRTS